MKSLIKHSILILSLCLILRPLYSEEEADSIKASKTGVELGKQKQYDEALKEFDKSIKYHNTTSAKTIHNKGWTLELKGDIPGAISAYEEAIKRNPDLIPSLERVGFLYYQAARYEEAVSIGERVIKLDPKNQEVIKWLPDAYTWKLKRQMEALAAKQDDDKKKKEDEIKKTVNEEAEKEPLLYATFDFMIRTGYYFRSGEKDKGYQYQGTPGLYFNVPEMMKINARPTKMFEFDLEFGLPYLGALMPDVIIHTEKLEAISHLGKFTLGIGEMVNHYRDDFAYGDGKKRTLNDFKTGIIFGFEKDDANVLFRFYPRLLPRDSSGSSGKTLDVDYVKLDYSYKIDKQLKFYSWMSARDYYFFDHSAGTSNYWGVYEFGLGLSLGKFKNLIKEIKYISVSLDYTQRFYTRDLNNNKPYKFANGQGWFGANSDKWFKGDPFSGYRSTSYVVSPRVEEGMIDNLFLYQKIIIEIVDRKEDHDEYNIQLGIGGVY